MASLDDLDTWAVETTLRDIARQLGLRPRTTIRYFTDWDAFAAAVVEPTRRSGSSRGMTGRGRPHGRRCVWVADHSHRDDLMETLTHEIAHALMPWRETHTVRWLDLHLAGLATLTSPAHAERVATVARIQYGLPAPPTDARVTA